MAVDFRLEMTMIHTSLRTIRHTDIRHDERHRFVLFFPYFNDL